MTASAFPLHWPVGFPRAKSREKGAFKTTLAGALKNVEESLRKFSSDSGRKITDLVISSNVTLGATNPSDSGVAIWFTWDGLTVCIPVDRYLRVEANLQAIHHIIEARRTEMRHGTLALVRATFSGFLALPTPPSCGWWNVLGVDKSASQDEIKIAYRKLCSIHHPDKNGGDSEKMAAINEAYRLSELN